MQTKLLSKVFFTILFNLALVYSTFSQIEIPLLPNGEPDSSLIRKTEPIPVNDIPGKIEETEEAVKMGERKILPKRSILQIDSLLPLFVEMLEEEEKSARIFIKSNPNRQKINNLINKWNGYYAQLDSWQEIVNNIEDKNQDIIIPFKEKEYLWQLTLELAKKENAPPSLTNNIRRTLKNVGKILDEIARENNNLIKLETDIIKLKGDVNSILDEFNHLLNSEVYNIFYKRHEVMWKMSFDKNADQNESFISESLPSRLSNAYKFIRDNQQTVYSYLFWMILFIAFFLWFKQSFGKVKFTEEDKKLQRAKNIINNHTISSIVFATAAMALLFFGSLPYLLSDILLIIALIASLPMLRSVMFNRFQNALYLIILFYVFNSLKTYIWFSSASYRVFILLESILVILSIYFFTKPFLQTRKMKMAPFGRFVIHLIPLIYALVVISIISNIIGYTNLTDLTLRIATQSSVLTMIFYSILLVASGLLIGGLHMIFIRQTSYNVDRKFYVEKKSLQFLSVGVFLWWVFYFLNLVNLKEPVGIWLDDFLITSYSFGSTSFNLGEVFSFIFVLVASFVLSSFISLIVDGGALSFMKLPKGIPAAISLVLRYFIIAFGFVLALSSLGIELGQFNLMAGALGLGIGFGLQTIISNFVSGLILVFERPILPGDTVEVQNLLGQVTNIGVRASKVRTFDGAEVIVPNNNLISNDLINWTLSDNVKRIEIKIGAAYGTDPNVVLKLLKEEAIKNEFTLADPEPVALFDQFGNSSLDFRLLVWVPYDKGIISKSIISIGVYNSFEENGIVIPFPQQDVYIKELAENGEKKKEKTRKEKPSKKDPLE